VTAKRWAEARRLYETGDGIPDELLIGWYLDVGDSTYTVMYDDAIQLWYLVLWPPATARINVVSRADIHGRVVSSLLNESERARMGLSHFEL
jgi:hypothetical protein